VIGARAAAATATPATQNSVQRVNDSPGRLGPHLFNVAA